MFTFVTLCLRLLHLSSALRLNMAEHSWNETLSETSPAFSNSEHDSVHPMTDDLREVEEPRSITPPPEYRTLSLAPTLVPTSSCEQGSDMSPATMVDTVFPTRSPRPSDVSERRF